MKADIFFFITTIAVIIISAALVAVLVYLFKILRDVLFLVKHAKKEGEEIINDVHNFRINLKEESHVLTSKWRSLINLILPSAKRKTARNHKKSEKNKVNPE